MKTERAAKALLAVTLSLALVAPLAPAVAQSEPAGPRLRLTATKSDLVARRHRHHAARLNVGVFVSALDQPLEMHVGRPSYDDPLQIDQVVETPAGQEIRPLPSEVLNEWNGLADFLSVDVADSSGTIIRSNLRSFCPNAYERQRVDDQGPVNSLYPYGCYANPFTHGGTSGASTVAGRSAPSVTGARVYTSPTVTIE